jgi:hypothetical protein
LRLVSTAFLPIGIQEMNQPARVPPEEACGILNRIGRASQALP